MPGCGPAVASMPLLSPLDCGPSRNLFCAFDSGKAQFLPDTDLPLSHLWHQQIRVQEIVGELVKQSDELPFDSRL